MSSFIGHSLMGWTIGVAMRHLAEPAPESQRHRWLWRSWLVIVALAPDMDYVVPWLHPGAHGGLRITHSLLSAALLPVLTLMYLGWTGVERSHLLRAGQQLTLASLSHIGLDLLVGVTLLPIVWPVSDHTFRLPFGILPSAGKPSLSNYYFYANLGIELGVLVPLIGSLLISKQRTLASRWRWISVSILLAIAVYFMNWAYGLSR